MPTKHHLTVCEQISLTSWPGPYLQCEGFLLSLGWVHSGPDPHLSSTFVTVRRMGQQGFPSRGSVTSTFLGTGYGSAQATLCHGFFTSGSPMLTLQGRWAELGPPLPTSQASLIFKKQLSHQHLCLGFCFPKLTMFWGVELCLSFCSQ